MSGNSVMGNENRDMSPSKVSIMDTTVDNTGLSMNRLSIYREVGAVERRQAIVCVRAPVVLPACEVNGFYMFSKLSSDMGCG